MARRLITSLRLDLQHCRLLGLFLADTLRCLSLRTALALTGDVCKRCSRIFLLSCSVALLGREGLVLVDDLSLENTLCDIHGLGLKLFFVEDIQILYF